MKKTLLLTLVTILLLLPVVSALPTLTGYDQTLNWIDDFNDTDFTADWEEICTPWDETGSVLVTDTPNGACTYRRTIYANISQTSANWSVHSEVYSSHAIEIGIGQELNNAKPDQYVIDKGFTWYSAMNSDPDIWYLIQVDVGDDANKVTMISRSDKGDSEGGYVNVTLVKINNNISLYLNDVFIMSNHTSDYITGSYNHLYIRVQDNTRPNQIDWIQVYNITPSGLPTPVNNFSITAKKYPSNGVLYNFTATINGTVYNDSGTGTLNTVIPNAVNYTGSFNVTTLDGKYSAEYIDYNTSVDLQALLYPVPGVEVFVYKEATGSLLNDRNVTVTFNIGGNASVYTITNGSLLVANLSTGAYQVTFEAENFTSRTYDLTFSNLTFQTLKAYLLAGGGTTVFTFKDFDTAVVLEGVTLTIQTIVNGSFQVVSVLTSDITGRAQFDYTTGKQYNFVATLTDYTDKSFILNPIIFTSYTVRLQSSTTTTSGQDYAGTSITFTPKIFYDAQNNTINFIFASPGGAFTSYGFVASYDSASASGSGSNAYGGTLTDDLEIIGATLGDRVRINYYYNTSTGLNKSFTFYYDIVVSPATTTFFGNRGETYGLGDFERVFIMTLLTLFVGGMGALFGGLLGGGVLAGLMLGYFSYIGFVSLWFILPSMLALFVIIAWGGKN